MATSIAGLETSTSSDSALRRSTASSRWLNCFREAGLRVTRVQEGPGFARFVIEDEDDRTELDLASDARLFPADRGPGFQILSAEELAADKLLAVFGRAEARDFVDLEALEDRFGLDRRRRER